MKSITAKPQQAQSERERAVLKVMAKKKNLMAFPNSSRGKKVSQDTKSEKKNEKGKKRTEIYTHMHTHTNAELHILLGLRPMLWRVPRLCCQLRGRMEDGEPTGTGGAGG